MLKKPGGKVLLVIALLLAGGLLLAGVVPAAAAGNGQGSTRCGGTGIGMGRDGGSLAGIVSDILGINRADLAKERQAGKSLVDIAAEKGVDKDKLVAAVMEKRQERLDQALQDKKITREQYDQCQQLMKTNLENNLSRTEVGPNGQGRNGGAGMGRGTGCGQGQCRGYCQQ